MSSNGQDTPDRVDVVEAERLKTLGNELYQRGEYDAARHRYTEAIKKNPKNAIFYANRAAVLLATKEYLEAAYDCKKATELDPTFAKAWGRLGTATHELADWHRCVEAWRKALDCLPKGDLTPMQQTLKRQFTEGLNKAMAARRRIDTDIVTIDRKSQIMPWDKAEALKPAKEEARKPSCVFVVTYAYNSLKEGMAKLDAFEAVKGANGREIHRGPMGVFQDLTNSILVDDRIFHLKDPNYFMETMPKQSILECESMRGFLAEGGPAAIRDATLKRLKTESWGTVRLSIAITIRIWIFQAFFRFRMFGHFTFAFEMYTRTIEFLEWGRKQWPNVPRSERGPVFGRSFIRAVKRLHLDLMHGSVSSKREESPYTFADLIDTATDLLEDVDSDPLPEGNTYIGHKLAYWDYIRGDALSILGWCHLEQGLLALNLDGDKDKSLNLIETASEYYLSAAECYPEDEQYHAAFLRKHLECLCYSDKPLRITLPLCERIRGVIPRALEVWATEPFDENLKRNLSEVEQFEARYKEDIMEGRLTLDSVKTIVIPTTRQQKTEKDNLPFKVLFPGDAGYEGVSKQGLN